MRVLVTGAAGLLGSAVVLEARARGHDVRAEDHATLDVTDSASVTRAVEDARPDAVVHCAAFTGVDRAEDGREAAMAVNAEGTAHVARAADAVEGLLLYPGTDYVFDGKKRTPYRPEDSTHPLNAYGRSKLAGEEAVRREADRWLIVRTAWLYGAGGPNFVDSMVERGRSEGRVRVVDDQTGSPTWTGSLAPALVELLEVVLERGDSPVGRVLHLVDRGRATWFDLARAALETSGVEVEVVPVSSDEWRAPAPRPPFSVLDPSDAEGILGRPMPEWRASLEHHLSGRAAKEGVPPGGRQ